ncbi:MAG: hypothetical protein MUC57_19210 [Desulfobacterales bacterium]|nr:hypothetical protein [Desulfobacterales bacterium]
MDDDPGGLFRQFLDGIYQLVGRGRVEVTLQFQHRDVAVSDDCDLKIGCHNLPSLSIRLVVLVERSCRPGISLNGVGASPVRFNASPDARIAIVHGNRDVFSDAALLVSKTAGVNTVNHAFRKYRIHPIPATILLN